MYKLIGMQNNEVMFVYDDITTGLDRMPGCARGDVYVIPASVDTEQGEGDPEPGLPVTSNPFMDLPHGTAMDCLRALRDARLVQWVDTYAANSLRWDALDVADQDAIKGVRTLLLDITEQPGAPYDVTWPEPHVPG